MLDNLFNDIEPMVDQDVFIAQIEEMIERGEIQFNGNTYELHRMLADLKSGGMDFKQFLEQAAGWSKAVNDQVP